MKVQSLLGQLSALLFLTLSSQVAAGLPTAAKSGPESPSVVPATTPAVVLRAASGATLPFVTQNGRTVYGVPPENRELPHLVLSRNGTLTDTSERTLIVEVSSIEVPPTGITVTLKLETQHRGPNSSQDPGPRITAGQTSRWIANTTGVTQTESTAVFVHQFTETVPSAKGPIATPSDYYRYEITFLDGADPHTDALHVLSVDYAFLIEDQWVAPLPPVHKESPGAAPDELVVYYLNMFPLQTTPNDPATRLPRSEITTFVSRNLVPRMVEAFRVQTDEWGFPWYQEWTSYRSEDPDRLSLALCDGETWFHGRSPGSGHSGISIDATGGNTKGYDRLTDALMSTFHHELFHNIQRNISLHSGGRGEVDGAERSWQFFSEGTAVLAASVGQPRGQFTQSVRARNYMFQANGFVERGGGRERDLNTSYKEMDPYKAVFYWRFLYEQCGGMEIIDRALRVLYAGDVVDIDASTDLVQGMSRVLDQALAGSSCPFQTHSESLIAFAQALYRLQVDGGRCAAPGVPVGCGLYDPYDQYLTPPVSIVSFTGADLSYRDEIGSSFGIDLIEVTLDSMTDGEPLTLEFEAVSGSSVELSVQIVLLTDSGGSAAAPYVLEATNAPVILRVTAGGRQTHRIPASLTTSCSRLGLVITRLDTTEATGSGEYTVSLRTGV